MSYDVHEFRNRITRYKSHDTLKVERVIDLYSEAMCHPAGISATLTHEQLQNLLRNFADEVRSADWEEIETRP